MKQLIALCCIAKQENLYLRDFVKYYKELGFNNIILYDNNDINGEYPQQVIGDYIEEGFVIYKDARGMHRYQLEAYNKCYEEYNNDYEWMAFFDVDEFLHLNAFRNIRNYLSQPCFNDCTMIGFSWLQYGDNGLLHYENKPVFERFTSFVAPYSNNNYKVVLRCEEGLKIDFKDANAFRFYTTKGTFISKTPSGVEVKDGNYWINNDYNSGYLKHYCTLTIEEFLYRRFGRKGYADKASSYNKDVIMKVFTDLNTITEEKQKIIDDFFSKFEIKEDNV